MSATNMPNLKITYFDMRGRAEPLRLACVVGGLDFEDDRFQRGQFGELRSTFPYKSVPTMEIDGKLAVQSMAMLRYLGKLTKLYPECPLDALKVDEAIDTILDMQYNIFSYHGDDKDILRKNRVKLAEEDIPRYMGGLEKRLASFGGEGPWLVGDDITIADLALHSAVTIFKCGLLEFISKDILDQYPRLMKSYHATMEHPKIAEWYKKHPIPGVTE